MDLSNYSRDEVAKNISTAHEDLLDTAGRVSPYFRPPNGDYDDVVVDTARSLGYETVIWAVDSLDWKNPGVDFMVERVLGRTFSGAIVLMHASDSSQQIQDALPLIIDGLRGKGFRLVPLSLSLIHIWLLPFLHDEAKFIQTTLCTDHPPSSQPVKTLW